MPQAMPAPILTCRSEPVFIKEMKLICALALSLLMVWSDFAGAAKEPEPKLLATIKPLPVALDRDFEFRKTKLFYLSEKGAEARADRTSKTGERLSSTAVPSKATTAVQDASITFERQYRLFGAVTKLDQHQRFGNYFDFFWRARRPTDLTVRLEYRQQKLHAHVQAQEISYANVQGDHKTGFKVIGDDYFDGGRVIAWRCLLIENDRIVAETRSFLWE
jgi:hypothetical protein